MKREEALVEQWLERAGFQQVVYTPDGHHRPPDFLVSDRLAIEVRRLNQLWFNGERYEGLEEVEAPTIQGIEAELKRIGPPRAGRSYFVSVTFQRPVSRWSLLKRRVAEMLQVVAATDHPEVRPIRIGRQLEFRFCPATDVLQDHFVLGAYRDGQAGGFVEAVLIDSVREIIREKTFKVRDCQHRYPEWWLLLVDQTPLRFNDSNGEVLRSAGLALEVWSRIIVLDRSGSQVIAELQSAR